MNPVVQLHARPRRLLRELAGFGIVADVRDGVVVLVGYPDRLPADLRDDVDANFAELREFVLSGSHPIGGLRHAR